MRVEDGGEGEGASKKARVRLMMTEQMEAKCH